MHHGIASMIRCPCFKRGSDKHDKNTSEMSDKHASKHHSEKKDHAKAKESSRDVSMSQKKLKGEEIVFVETDYENL